MENLQNKNAVSKKGASQAGIGAIFLLGYSKRMNQYVTYPTQGAFVRRYNTSGKNVLSFRFCSVAGHSPSGLQQARYGIG